MWGYKHRDPAIRSRARDQAAWLIRDHGDEAEAVLRAKMARPNLSRDDEYRFKLTLEELRRQLAEKQAGHRHGRHRRTAKPGVTQRLLDAIGINRDRN